MKNTFYTLCIALFLFSCASKTVDNEKIQEIAIATQRVGEQYYNAGKYTLALKKLLEAQKKIPNEPSIYNSLGLVYMAKERYGMAETEFKKALSLNKDYINVKNNLGATYLKLKKWDRAIELFNEIAEDVLYATPEIPYSNLGWAYYHQKKFEKAKSYFYKALDIRPNYLVPAHGLSTIYIETGYQYQAIDFLHRLLKRNPNAAILHFDLARAYESINKWDKAKRAWKIVLSLEPEFSPLAKEAEKRLYELN
ncbi:MAG: tetratricopeptide repeat protein [Desulfobacula sp.]|nr:tetratricopeptide repeat protein [Desulfobacula sp.]